ncbi:MAG: 16S rRNA (guanine(966)-N(2))-methyltransferase RsmD [Epulopiscium sp.]|nr:16S rRNA (guanine(966)-N(2))-methyltransferase RsmD [Candidatus Epulonipiscium sp.]
MRVIAGSAKGHRLQVPVGLNTRPTAARIKESIFNMIALDLPGCQFLDLFSGSGSMGIEAISRGADHAIFVENNPMAIQSIQRNLQHTKFQKYATVYQNDVIETLYVLARQKQKFDIIFMDPPYNNHNIVLILNTIKEYDLLNPDGYIIVEHEVNYSIEDISTFKLWKEKKYKTTTMTFLILQEAKR